MVGLIVICLAVFVGIFAYYLGTDSTPNADREILEIMAAKPGASQLFLRVKKEKIVQSTGFFKRLLFGAEDKYLYVPINSFKEKGDSVYVEKYIDEGLQEKQVYSKNELAGKNFIETKTFWLGTDTFLAVIF